VKNLITLMVLLIAINSSNAQDSLAILRFEDYLSIVMDNHPVMQQAQLQPDMADASLMMAKGMLDPTFQLERDIKQFDEKNYWDMLNSTLKIPTWIPLDPKLSVDRNTGLFLNPQDGIPTDNDNLQFSAGLALPIGRGLFIDERRATILQAKIYRDIAAAEQLKMTNKLLFTVIKDYLYWSLAYQELNLLDQSVDIAAELYRRVRLDYTFGEAAVVDTVQAIITLQTRQADYQKTLYSFIAAGLNISNHLWTSDGIPLELKSATIPDTMTNFGVMPEASTIQSLIDWAMINHPDIQSIEGKTEQLTIENRLAKEYLKPQVDLSYTLIDAPINPAGEFQNPSFNDNYKMGLDIYFPLLLRKERGKLAFNKLKIQDVGFERDYRRQTITNDINSRFAELQMAESLTNQYRMMANNYERLLEAELLNLETGESDLFKLNIQQDKFIESQLKYLFYLTKFQTLKAEILHDAGNLYPTLSTVSN
jgi:outer membrane protein TolC